MPRPPMNLKPKPKLERQSERFIGAARELGCDEDEEAFKAKLKRNATPKPTPPVDTPPAKPTRLKPR
jgi:hypothetical protein